jgi:two-component system, OmpR family, sensor histidine kinase QseC
MMMLRATLKPSLRRRIFIPLFVANIAVWITVLTLNILAEPTIDVRNRTGEVQRRSAILERCNTEQEAIIMARVLAVFYEWSPDVPILFELWRSESHSPQPGRRLYFNQKNLKFNYAPLIGDPGKVTEIVANGKKYNLIRQDGPRWSLRVAIPQPLQPLHEYITEFGTQREYLTQMATSFFLLTLMLWAAMRRGLQPLQLLAQRIAQRQESDLSPLNVDAKYAELQPMAQALEAMMLQLGASIGREQTFIQHAGQQLQQPLVQITALVQILASEANAAEKQAASEQIDAAITRTSHLIQQLLEMAWVDGMQIQEKHSYDIAELVRLHLAKTIPGARARQISLALEAPEHLPYHLERNSLQLILQNLLDNAIRYGQIGGMVEVELSKEGDSLLLSVTDDGPGIPADLRESVFERFYRGADSASFGSGLGLAIARQAAKRMGATLTISTSLQGQGCRFLLRIPGEV